MSSYSPYAVAESQPPVWKSGENLAAAAFIGASLYLVLDINVSIWRVFKKRQGLYYWAMLLGSLAVAVDALGVILKFLTPNAGHIWGLYTTLLLTGWTFYAPAQLFVLYSRLHLVNNVPQIQRWILILILSTPILLILPTWVVVWPAYDPDSQVSSSWSPRDAIVERYNQIGFTLVECVLSGVYIWSLLGLLNLKSSVRQRRVMLDLIYVNVIILCLDFAVVILIYLNQLGISHPLQSFSYALKLKLEFVVLNQLMAVAARGMQRDSFAERRYHHSSTNDAFDAECRQWDEKPASSAQKEHRASRQNSDGLSSRHSVQLSVPAPARSKSNRTSRASNSSKELYNQMSRQNPGPGEPAGDNEIYDHEQLDDALFGGEQGLEFDDFLANDRASNEEDKEQIDHHPSQTFSGETLRPHQSAPQKQTPKHFRPAAHGILRSMRHPLGNREHRISTVASKLPIKASLKKHLPKKQHDGNDELDEEEEVGVHMWERRATLVLEVPWFKSKIES